MYHLRTRLGRNDACWCGSQNKYKKCHMGYDDQLKQLWLMGEEVLPHELMKTPGDIENIKRSAAINIGALDYVAQHIKPGVTTGQIDQWVHDYTVQNGGIPADLGFEGFPKSCCTSVNEVVCHGVPDPDRVLREGDILNVDCSTILNGYYSDSARMFCIGEVSEQRRRIVEVVERSVEEGLRAVKPWGHLGDVSWAVQKYVESQGFSVVREFGGHGIGLDFHEEPFVSFVGEPGTDVILAPGFCFTIEPMINAGAPDIDMSDPDGWTIRTADGSDSAQKEVQLVVTEDGYELISW